MTEPLVCLISCTAGRMLLFSCPRSALWSKQAQMTTGTHLFAFTAHWFSRRLFVQPGDTVWCPAVMRSTKTFTVTLNYCSSSEQEEHTLVNKFYNTISAPCRKMEMRLSLGYCSSPHVLHPKPIMRVCMVFYDGLVSHRRNIPVSRLAFLG